MKTRKLQFLLLMLILLTAGGVVAQDTLRFSLEEAKAYALENSYTIRNSSLDVAAARKKVWETIATGLPQVKGSASYTNFLNLPVSLIPGQFFGEAEGTYVPVKFGQDYNSDFGFTVDQLLFDGSYIVGVSSAKIYLQLSTLSKEKAVIEIRHAVEQAYYSTLVAKSNLDVMNGNLQNNQKLLTDTKALFDNGFVEEQDVDQMQLIVQRAENEIMKAEREIRVAEMVLKYTLGVDVENPISLTDKLTDFIEPLIQEENGQTAFDHTGHVDYKLLDAQRQANYKLLQLEKSAFLPTISAFYSWNKAAYGNSWNLYKNSVAWFPSSMWGLNISVPIFSSGMRLAKVRQAQLELEKSENDQKQSEQALQRDYLMAIADIESSVDQLKNDVDNKKLAKTIYDKTKIKYNNGLVSSTELAQTESQYIQAQGSWVASVMQLFNSKISLDRATGK